MNETRRWKVIDGGEKDVEKILALRRVVFGEMERDKLDPRFWQWEFIKNPDGKALIYLVEDQSKIIGHFADIPRRFSVAGEAVLGTLSLDLMVHPDYWRKGVFEAMGKYGAHRVKQENGLFLFAFPIRPETIHGLKKIGWKEVVKLPVLVYPIKFSGIVNRYLHFLPLSLFLGGLARILYTPLFILGRKRKGNGIEIEQGDQLDQSFDLFLEKANSLYPIMGIRDRRYMCWRYLGHPTRNYTIYRAMRKREMQGYIILRKVNLLGFNSAVIVDLLALGEDVLMALVETGIAFSHRIGTDLLGFMVPETHPYNRLLKKRGFLRTPKTFRLMIYSHTEDKELLNPKAWYVTWGDTDVI